MELKEQYPEAWDEVMNAPLKYLWDNMEFDRQEEILKGITKNLEV